MSMNVVLPPTKNGSIPLGVAGEWARLADSETLFVRTLAEALNVTTMDVNAARIFSIPDVWAQIELFKTAFIDDRHVLHRRAIGAWRGLLGLLGLAGFRGYAVSSKVISINSLAENPFHSKVAAEEKVNLAKVLRSMPPAGCLLRGQHARAWDELALIYLDSRPVGLMVPTTMVCPARGVLPVLRASVPWIVDGRLKDPTTCDRLTADDFEALRIYIEQQRDNLNGIATREDINPDLQGHLNGQLNAYINDLVNAVAGRPTSQMSVTDYTPLERPGLSLYARLNHLPSGDATSAVSDAVLPMESWVLAGGGSSACQAVVYDDQLPQQLSKADTDLTLWRSTSFSHFASWDDARRKQLTDEMLAEQTLLLTADDIFTSRIFRLDGANIEAHPLGLKDYILPLRPKILYFLDPPALARALTIDDQAGLITVSLRLSLQSSRTGRQHHVLLRKRYSSRHTDGPPVLGVYPSFTRSGFSQYFMPFSSNLDASPLVDTPFAAGMAARLASRGPKETLEALRLDKVIDQDAVVKVVEESMSGIVQVGVLRLEHQPSAVICRRRSADGPGKSRREEYAGIVLLPEVKNPSVGEENWKVAIDLGSTNTSAHYCRGQERPQAMEFTGQVVSPLGLAQDEWRDELARRFLPTEITDMPLLSALEDFSDLAAGKRGPLVDGRIFYQPKKNIGRALQEYQNDQAKEGRRRIHFNLKWRDSLADIRRLQSFVGQVALQSLVEVVSRGANPDRISWYFSYPLSMGNHLTNVAGSFHHAVAALNGDGGGAGNALALAKERTRFVTESQAAAGYFKHKLNVSFAGAAITVDMGGVTSDICLWRKNHLVWQNSLMFGGRDVLVMYLERRREVLKTMATDCSHPSLRKALQDLTPGQLDGETLPGAVEMVVNSPEFGDLLESQLGVASGAWPYSGLVLTIKVALAGLCAYLGMVSQHFRLQNAFGDTQLPLQLCLGGRGSKAFKTIIETDATVKDSLWRIYDKYSLGNEKVNFVFSRDHKQEVSYGLLLGDDELPSAKDASEAIISGEDLMIGQKKIGYFDELGPDDVLTGVGDIELKQFRGFLQEFNRLFDARLPWTDDIQRYVLTAVREQMEREQRRLTSNTAPIDSGGNRVTQVTSPFINALKAYIAWICATGVLGGESRA